MINRQMIMKRHYTYPSIEVQQLSSLVVLCASSDPASEFSGGTGSGDAGGAHAPQRQVF